MNFDEKYFLKNLRTNFLGKKIKWFSEIGSTQDIAKEIASKENCDGYLIGSESLINGYGQYNRSWFTNKSKGLYFSMILKNKDFLKNKQHSKLLLAISLVTTFEKKLGIKCKVKFPNDVYYKNKKIAGVLQENLYNQNSTGAVVGIGINVNDDLKDFNKDILEKTTSLKIITNKKISREDLLISILEQLEHDYMNYIKYGYEYLNSLFSKWAAKDLLGKLKSGEIIEGSYAGINEDGYLLMRSYQTNKIYIFEYGSLVELRVDNQE